MFASKLIRFVVVIGLTALVLSCDVAGGLFSQSELANMYDVWIDMDGLPLSDGDLIQADSSLVPIIESHSGFSGPERLSLVLVDVDGNEAARLGFVAESGPFADTEDDPSLRAVLSMEGSLPSFTLPDDLAEGYYSLEIRLYDSTDIILSDTSILVLLYNGEVPAPRIEIFPSSPAKGQAVYLRLVSGLPDELDPWLRWYVGGGIRKEGYESDFADRLVWQIPESDGFFSVRAELFPFKPPTEAANGSISVVTPHSSAFRADLILAVGPAQPASPLDGAERLHFMDFKSEPEILMLEASDGTTLSALMVGIPYLESHEHGYGHALVEGAGYMITDTILPQAGTPFSLGITFDPADDFGASGALVTLYGEDGASSFLRLGVSGGLPYLEAGDSIVQAFTGLPAGLCRLVLEVVPPEADTTESIVSLFLNDELVGNGAISGGPFERAGPVTTLVGGPEGLDAVYDELAVTAGRYQAFFVARAHEFGSRLVAASGFEGGAIGRNISVMGPAEAGDGFIELPLDSSLEIPVPAGGFTVDIGGYGAALELALVMNDGSTVVLLGGKPLPGMEPGAIPGEEPETDFGAEQEVVAGEETGTYPGGEQGLDSADSAVTPTWMADQPISLSVELVSGGLRISDGAGRNERLPVSQPATVLRVQPAWSGLSTIRSILVRSFNSRDSFNRTTSISPAPLEATGN
ncbi:MAG: hypothetical protein ABIJ86_11660 [Spirochaetota bacterium]